MRGIRLCCLERFTIEMAFISASENKDDNEQKRSHSGGGFDVAPLQGLALGVLLT